VASGVWDMLKLEWQVGLRRLPFFTQRLAVALLGLLLVSLALVGALAVVWGGPQDSDLPLRPPPGAGHPARPNQVSGIEPPSPPHPRGGAEAPASARSSTSSSSSSTSSTTVRRHAATSRTAPPSSTTTTTTPPTTRDNPVAPLTVPPVLSTLLP
jgi:hypothetical protein